MPVAAMGAMEGNTQRQELPHAVNVQLESMQLRTADTTAVICALLENIQLYHCLHLAPSALVASTHQKILQIVQTVNLGCIQAKGKAAAWSVLQESILRQTDHHVKGASVGDT